MNKPVVLFGGAFDPPHLGHQLVIEQVFKQVKPAEIWLLPCYQHTFQKQLTESRHRVAMTNLIGDTIGDERLKIKLIEIERQSGGSTFQTWQWLTKQYPNHQFAFVMGSDNLTSFTQWHRWEKLLQSMLFYIYIRKGYPPEPWYTNMTLLNGDEVSEVSSTQVRKRLEAGQGISDLVPKSVEDYIRQQGLYR